MGYGGRRRDLIGFVCSLFMGQFWPIRSRQLEIGSYQHKLYIFNSLGILQKEIINGTFLKSKYLFYEAAELLKFSTKFLPLTMVRDNNYN